MNDEDIMPPRFDWFQDWERYRDFGAKCQYAEIEVKRAIEAGLPPLHLAIMLPLSMMQDAAMAALNKLGHYPMLRLRPGAVAPPNRPNHHLGKVPEAERGKVLYAKAGTLGPPSGPKAVGPEAAAWGGNMRQTKLRTREELYLEVKITHTAKPVKLEWANPILRLWGVGGKGMRYQPNTAGALPNQPTDSSNGQDRWIVEEVTQAMLDREQADANAKASSGKATKRDAQTAAA